MGTDHAATFFYRSRNNTLNKCAGTEGMGSGIPIKFAGKQKPWSGFWVTQAKLALIILNSVQLWLVSEQKLH